VRVVPNGIDASEFPTSKGPGHGFLYAGRLSAEKGVGTLVEAAARARVPLEIAGDGPASEDLRRQAQRSGADIRFLGRLDREPLLERLWRARAVVLPSEWYENAPMAALEALASGVPVVGAAIGGIPEMVRDGETGLVFEPRNVEGLAACLVRLDAEPDFAHRLGARGREVVEREFSLADQVDRMLEILGEVTSSASR
jgi:glycosyltransferase involved in cell wall biosynthesis